MAESDEVLGRAAGRVVVVDGDDAVAGIAQPLRLGEEGVDLGKLYDYDIILLDLNLPDMSGYDVLKQLRVSKIKTPILILSGLAGIEVDRRMLAELAVNDAPAFAKLVEIAKANVPAQTPAA